MVGVIRKRDILAHPMVTVRCFGWGVFLKTLVAGRRQTFLSLLMSTDVLQEPPDPDSRLVGRCVQLELQAKNLYEDLARRFADSDAASKFFKALARQEDEHAELLELCREAARRGAWKPARLALCADAVGSLEETMRQARAHVDAAPEIRDALRLVARIESSEVNRVFRDVVAAADSDFVRAHDAFTSATKRHLTFIAAKLPELDPTFESPWPQPGPQAPS